MVGKNQSDLTPTYLLKERLHLLDAPQFEIDQGGLIEPALEQPSPGGCAERAFAALGRVSGCQDKRRSQARERTPDFP